MAKINYIFVRTIEEKSRVRVKAYPNQLIEEDDGGVTEVDTDMNVQCDTKKRTAYPIGTTFAVRGLKRAGTFYSVPDSQIHPVEVPPTSGDETELTEHTDMIDAWKTFKSETDPPEVVATSSGTTKADKSTLIGQLKSSKKLAHPSIEECGFFIPEETWYLILRNIKRRINTMLVGPTGSGKTELVRMIAQRTGKTAHFFDMGAMHDPIPSLLGTHRIDAEGKSVFDRSRFSQVIEGTTKKLDDIIVLDEISRAPASANNILFPCLDSRRSLPIEIAAADHLTEGEEDDRNISVAEDVVFFSTANLGAEYTGTHMLDRALLDRFFIVEVDYIPRKKEIELLQERVGIAAPLAGAIAETCENIRLACKKGDLSTAVSTRHSLEVASLVKDGFDKLRAFEMVLTPLFEGSKSEGERSVIYSIIAKM